MLGLKLLEGFKLQAVGDPFTYHLSAPRYWYQSGSARFTNDFPIFYLSASWEYLYLWAYELIGGTGSEGLIAGQHFCQWLVAGLGLIGTIGAVWLILRELTSHDRLRTAVGVTVLLSIPLFTTFCHTAKNDAGVLSWVFAGCALSLLPLRSKRTAFGIGFLFGSAVAAKFTTVLFAGPWLLLWMFTRAEGIAFVTSCLAGGLLSFLPIAARNYIGTSNPFFPSLNGVFHSTKVLPSWAAYLKEFQGGFWNASRSERLLLDLIHSVPTNLFLLLAAGLALLGFLRARPPRTTAAFRLLPFLIFPIFLWAIGNGAELRLGAPIVVLLSILTVDELLLLSTRLGRQKITRALALGLSAWCLAASNLPLYAVIQAFRYPSSDQEIRSSPGAEGKQAIRDFVPGNERVYIEDGEYYYVLYKNIATLDTLIEGS